MTVMMMMMMTMMMIRMVMMMMKITYKDSSNVRMSNYLIFKSPKAILRKTR